MPIWLTAWTGTPRPDVRHAHAVGAERRALGIVLMRLPDGYRVNYRNGDDDTARLAEDLDQADEQLGRALAPDAPATAVRRGRSSGTLLSGYNRG